MQVKQVRFLAQAALLALFPAAMSAQDMFKGCPTHCGEYQGAPRTLDTPAWTFKANGPILSSAAVADGVAYFGSDDKNLYALCIKSGEVVWKFATGGMVRSSPAVSGGIVYFASYDGNIYAVCAKSGELVWKFATDGERHFEARGLHGYKPVSQTIPDYWDLFESSPLVSGGLVYCGSGDGNMYALDAATGEKRWAVQTGDVVHSSPALADGTLYFGSFDTYMYAVDAITGAEKWRFKTGDDPQAHNRTGIQASPTVSCGTVFFGCRDFNFYAVDADTGLEKWRHNITWANGTASVSNGVVYYGTSIPAFVVGLDVATGEVRMKLPMPIMVFSSPIVSDGLAYAGCFDGRIQVIDLASSKVVDEFQSEQSLSMRGTILRPEGGINNQSIFRGDSYEDMYQSGEKLFAAGAILASPVVSDGMLLVGSADGTFFAFR